MANNNLTALAEFAAANENLPKVALCDLEEQIHDVLRRALSDLYDSASLIADVRGIGSPSVANFDEATENDLSQAAQAVKDRIYGALSTAVTAEDGTFFLGFCGSVDPNDRTTFQAGFAIRNTEIRACEVNGTRIVSKMPLSASMNLVFQFAVKITNSAANSRVGIGYRLGVEGLSIRAGMSLAAFNRLTQISSVQRGAGDNFGCQYQIYVFPKVNSFALGYYAQPFDFDDGRLPAGKIACEQVITDWKTDDKAGA